MSGRDYQRSKVYAWERAVIAPRDIKPVVAYDRAQSLVTSIWMAEGLRHPPRVEPMPMQARRVLATGSRTTLRLPPKAPTWVVLHEIAHAMAGTIDTSDQHGPRFVGLYMRLLDRFVGIPLPLLWYTASKAEIDYDRFAKPAFLDAA